MSRQVTVHPSASCKLTGQAQTWTQILNDHMRQYPTTTLYQLSRQFGMSYTSARRYYYGMHQQNDSFGKGNYNQVRLGVKFDL